MGNTYAEGLPKKRLQCLYKQPVLARRGTKDKARRERALNADDALPLSA